jgi:hypothetical protein
MEVALRVVSVVAMAALAWRLWTGASAGADQASMAGSASLDSALSTWSVEPPARATVAATSMPNAEQRDWLVAVRRTGSGVSWSSADTIGSAAIAESAPLPGARARLWVVAAPNTPVTLADRVGRVDSTMIRDSRFAAWRLQPLGPVDVHMGTTRAIAAPRDSLTLRPVLVVGAAGWESKFVTAALEEDGWMVTSRVSVAPGAVVRQGAQAPIDTASFSAVLVLDSTSALDASAVTKFVNSGGGLVAAGPGVHHPSLRSLLPRTNASVPGALGGLLGNTPQSGLNARGFALTVDLVVLERRLSSRDAIGVIVAKRVGLGRVVALGYDDTWRWRMTSPNEVAPAAQRAWWSNTVGSVARVGLAVLDVAVDEAPFAATVAALGSPTGVEGLADDGRPVPWDAILAAVTALALLFEWLSRRLRGVA